MKHEDISLIFNKEQYIGKNVTVCGWIKAIRKSKNVCFIELNDGTTLKNIQLVVDNLDIRNSDFINDISVGSSISANGIILNSMNKSQEIELNVQSVEVLGKCSSDYPIQKKKQSMEYLREFPHLRIRTNTFNAVFRIRSAISKIIHDYFQKNNFAYINTPIITGSDFEGAGQMFKVTTLDINQISKEEYNPDISGQDFFGKQVGLTLSGQLEAEAMAHGLGKVYTFGPVFRAENSNTKRHASEFWLIESEMAFADLNDTIEIITDVFKYVVRRILIECRDEIIFFTKYYDNELYDRLINIVDTDFKCITYSDAIRILGDSGIKFEFPVYWGCEITREHEKYLVDEFFKSPVFIKDFPKETKPFYTKVNSDGKTVAFTDLYLPGLGEIIGASEREEDYETLKNRILELNMNLEEYLWYLDLRKYGTVPHSGFAIGLERLVMYITGMQNIRDTILFPRVKCKNFKL